MIDALNYFLKYLQKYILKLKGLIVNYDKLMFLTYTYEQVLLDSL